MSFSFYLYIEIIKETRKGRLINLKQIGKLIYLSFKFLLKISAFSDGRRRTENIKLALSPRDS
ncbi:MAG: hypothetical protein C0168_03750 [Candidatus Aminicenantes bacterium]|nr:MAG: hypothetical protein C0168_03750 [Candidatus Aminicenantes bacterium]